MWAKGEAGQLHDIDVLETICRSNSGSWAVGRKNRHWGNFDTLLSCSFNLPEAKFGHREIRHVGLYGCLS